MTWRASRRARLAKLVLVVAAAQGRRVGEAADLKVARELVRCSGAIRSWLVAGMEQQKMETAAEKGREDATRRASFDVEIEKKRRNEEKLLDRLSAHGHAGPCPAAHLDQLFNSKDRANGRDALRRLIEREWVQRVRPAGRKTDFYTLTTAGELEMRLREERAAEAAAGGKRWA